MGFLIYQTADKIILKDLGFKNSHNNIDATKRNGDYLVYIKFLLPLKYWRVREDTLVYQRNS